MGKQQKHNLVFFQAKSKTNCSHAAITHEAKGKEVELAACCPLWLRAGSQTTLLETASLCSCDKTLFQVQSYFFVLQHDPEAFPDVLATGISRVVEGCSFLGPTAGLRDDEYLIFGGYSAHEATVSPR